MTPIKVISNGKGEAREKNPYGGTYVEFYKQDKYLDFERTHPPLPIYKSGKLFLEPGEVSCKVVWQANAKTIDRIEKIGRLECKFHYVDNWVDCSCEAIEVIQSEKVIKVLGKFEHRQIYNVLEPATIEAGKLSNLTVEVEYFGEAGYIAYVKQDKGLLVQGDSVEECLRELATSIEALLSIKKALGHEQ